MFEEVNSWDWPFGNFASPFNQIPGGAQNAGCRTFPYNSTYLYIYHNDNPSVNPWSSKPSKATSAIISTWFSQVPSWKEFKSFTIFSAMQSGVFQWRTLTFLNLPVALVKSLCMVIERQCQNGESHVCRSELAEALMTCYLLTCYIKSSIRPAICVSKVKPTKNDWRFHQMLFYNVVVDIWREIGCSAWNRDIENTSTRAVVPCHGYRGPGATFKPPFLRFFSHVGTCKINIVPMIWYVCGILPKIPRCIQMPKYAWSIMEPSFPPKQIKRKFSWPPKAYRK